MPMIADEADLAAVLITDALKRRRARPSNPKAEIRALHLLARCMVDRPEGLLKEFATLARELCRAGSAGISLLETTGDGRTIFRWSALAGALEGHEGGSTPRDFSPCGLCLDQGQPILLSGPGRVFTYFQEAGIDIVEGLVVPFYGADHLPLGTLWILSHDDSRQFDQTDVEIITGLAGFTALALTVTARATAREAPALTRRPVKAQRPPAAAAS